MAECFHITVTGQVQGVGFRPHVYKIATKLNLVGTVHNDGQGVKITLEASQAQLQIFIKLMSSTLPRLARIDNIATQLTPHRQRFNCFSIINSQQNTVDTQISPDAATCPECLAELLDKTNRRYRYPFINCTHCGPRYSIIKKLPYDRAFTTMATFFLCEECQQEYNNPHDRRFHAQPNACSNCGSQLTLLDQQQQTIEANDLVTETVNLLTAGNIIAIKGLGGYHLVCDAYNTETVARLRKLKQRKTKPLSLMVANLERAEKIAYLPEMAKEYLSSSAAPIVLLKKKDHQLDDLAPRMSSLGVMLPYTPIHHLLFNSNNKNSEQSLTLVMTSANLRGQPLIFQDDFNALLLLADYVLTHNRAINKRCDDSIVNCVLDEENYQQAIVVRRARGMAPIAIDLPVAGKSTLAVGGHLKNSVCLTKGNKAYLSPYIGDLDNPDNCRYLQETVAHLMDVFQIVPEQVVCDLHPDYYSSQFAEQFAYKHQIPLIKIQHHHAHAAAVACEQKISSPYLALSLDGVGLGDDNSSWGGECLLINDDISERLAHFKPLILPGGDIAAKQPWRLACAFLQQNNLNAIAQDIFSDESGFNIVSQMIKGNSHCLLTNSVGRLFDLAAALLGLTNHNSFEAEAAMLLESACNYGTVRIIEPLFNINDDNQLDFTALLLALVKMNSDDGAATFHYQLVYGLTAWLLKLTANNTKNVVLTGGCFLNQKLTSALRSSLMTHGFIVHFALNIPPNDSALALGQAWAVLNKQIIKNTKKGA